MIGAGLMHNIFMPDRATLIELFIDGSGANRHFSNLAHWYGRNYEGVSSENPVDVRNIVNIVRSVINSMNLNTYQYNNVRNIVQDKYSTILNFQPNVELNTERMHDK